MEKIQNHVSDVSRYTHVKKTTR